MDDRVIKDLLDFITLKNIKYKDPREEWLINEARKTLWYKLEKKIPIKILEEIIKKEEIAKKE